MTHHRLKELSIVILVISCVSACAKAPYKPRGDLYPNAQPVSEEPQFSRGEPNVIADSLGHYLFSLPEKLVLWNWQMGNHDISPETEATLRA